MERKRRMVMRKWETPDAVVTYIGKEPVRYLYQVEDSRGDVYKVASSMRPSYMKPSTIRHFVEWRDKLEVK